ncbi:MAG: HAD hydrolase-like protein [Bacteroidales bacterium]|nr:HAD hydrolase-like protein [Bacteroidales bacterium]
MSVKQYLLFDLDGTLMDPKVGITTCVQYALQSFGIEEPDIDKLEPFIGPPLRESFIKYYGFSREQAEEAVAKYREHFENTGIFENKVYEGIPKMLKNLKNKGMHLAVASSKPQVFVERILEHFHLKQYFEVVVGCELDGKREKKSEVVAEALNRLFQDKPVEKDLVYMIGDRNFDVEGAKSLHVECVGVTYGYGSMEELKAAKADYIVQSVEELEKFLLRGTEEQEKVPLFTHIWNILYYFLIFFLVRQIAMYALNLIVVQMGTGAFGSVTDFLFFNEGNGGLTGNATTIMSAIGFIAGGAAIFSTAKILIARKAEEMRLAHLTKEPVKNYFLAAVATVGATLGLNLLLELTGMVDKSRSYQSVVEDQYSAYFLVGIICYGVISPIAEELLFRGIFYNYMKRFWNVKTAILLSAAVFGVYHMNFIQGVYAFFMGCLIAYSYDYFGSFVAPVCIHIAANILAYSMSYTAMAVTGFVSWQACIICLGVAVGSLSLLEGQKHVLT